MLNRGYIMGDIDELLYSSEATTTEYLFFSDFNSINIFVEDAGKEYEYETIFKRLLGNQYRIVKIFGVGGKIRLKQCFQEFGITDKDNFKIKNVYIADGDFDRYIYPQDMIISPNFIYLETYNIENYLIDKKACENFAKGYLKCLDSEVEIKMGFNKWKSNIVEQASKLFLLYAFIKKEYPTIPSVSRSPYSFIDSKTGLERSDAFNEYKREILSIDSEVETKVDNINKCYLEIHSDYFSLICGKFLFESLYCHIRTIIGKTTFRKDDFRWYLINHFDTSSLDYVRHKIINIMQECS